ncbi:hypothetical protein [Corynebacterium sp. HS2168-gen11]|uniref:hypothetical protein n=1 Tax=Corynebacterium sp. HS2168-gen11 TaxID=2974027 RepID=UPI0037C04DA9
MVVNIDDSKPAAPAPKLRVKPWHVLFLAVLIICTWALAWWQWTRFQSGTGTFQNLGYAFQWPFFGFFFVFAYRKILQYENEKAAFEAEQNDPFVLPNTSATPTTIAEDFLPERKSLSVEEFNELHKPTRRRSQP